MERWDLRLGIPGRRDDRGSRGGRRSYRGWSRTPPLSLRRGRHCRSRCRALSPYGDGYLRRPGLPPPPRQDSSSRSGSRRLKSSPGRGHRRCGVGHQRQPLSSRQTGGQTTDVTRVEAATRLVTKVPTATHPLTPRRRRRKRKTGRAMSAKRGGHRPCRPTRHAGEEVD